MRVFLIAAAVTAAVAQGETNAELEGQVRKTEIAFAKTMADRDLKAFATFLASEAVFTNGSKAARGAAAVMAEWKPLYEGPVAPFSWTPETVQVLDSGTLALSSGPVLDPKGKRVGTFNSIWRREASGSWKVVIDHGCPACNCTPVR
jgi:ketosteroid isomerase-like protein